MGHSIHMVARREITRYVKQVAREFSPEKVILFGSYAQGRASKDSDVDLLVIMTHDKDASDQALEIRKRIDRSFPLDLLVRTPQEVRRRVRQHDGFLTSIIRDGELLYERRA